MTSPCTHIRIEPEDLEKRQPLCPGACLWTRPCFGNETTRLSITADLLKLVVFDGIMQAEAVLELTFW